MIQDCEESYSWNKETRDNRRKVLEAMRSGRTKINKLARAFARAKAKLLAEERALRQQLNTHTPIARLKDEVLGLVFQAYTEAAIEAYLVRQDNARLSPFRKGFRMDFGDSSYTSTAVRKRVTCSSQSALGSVSTLNCSIVRPKHSSMSMIPKPKFSIAPSRS